MLLGMVVGCRPPVPSAVSLAASAPPAARLAAVDVPDGERLAFALRVGPFDGGRAEITASPATSRPDRRLLRVRVSSRGVAGRRRLDDRTWVDGATGRPVRSISHLAAAGEASSVETLFDPSSSSIDVVERRGRAVRRARQVAPGGGLAFNLPSALHAVRAWSRGEARPTTVDVMARSRLWRVTVRRRGDVTLETASGAERSIQIDGLAWRARADGSPDADGEPRRFRVFLAARPDRRPLRVEIDGRLGVLRAELVGYRAGRSSSSPGIAETRAAAPVIRSTSAIAGP